MTTNDDKNRKADDDSFEWKRLLLRKDRPLPKAGCSWMFYIFLLLLIAYLVFTFIKYKNQ